MLKQQGFNGHTQKRAARNKYKVLVIDDNEDHLELTQTILERSNFEVVTATSGLEALSLLATTKKPNLILLDLYMRDFSGTDLLALLEKEQREIIETVPVVFFTGVNKVPRSRAVGFIQKPIDMDKLVEAVAGFIEAGTNYAQSKS